jgi:hypothetical protein
MFTTKQYRAKAVEYGEAKTSIDPDQRRDFQKIEQSFTVLADNEHHASEQDPNGATLTEEEEHILRCLGAALIMQWNTLPSKLQRELVDTAGSMGDLLDTPALRGQIARFLHRHKDDADTAAT